MEEPIETQTSTDDPSSSAQVVSETGECVGGIDTEIIPPIESATDEPMDVEVQAGSSSSRAQFRSNIGEYSGGIDTEHSPAIEYDVDESIGLEVSTEISDYDEDCPEFDVGKWIGKSSQLSDAEKLDILNHRWVPPTSYNFHADSNDPKRRFLHGWLSTYAPWLSYSKKLKGGLCLFCVVFPPITVQGVLGSFIVKPFDKYKDLHQACKSHALSQWHQASTMSAKSFMDDVPVNIQMISGHDKMIEENRKIISSIISNIIFCGTNNIPLRGKTHDGGNFLINFISYFNCKIM